MINNSKQVSALTVIVVALYGFYQSLFICYTTCPIVLRATCLFKSVSFFVQQNILLCFPYNISSSPRLFF